VNKNKVFQLIAWGGIALSSIMSGGCATGPVYSPSPEKPEKAIIYIYREHHGNNAPGVVDTLYINNNKVGALYYRGYYVCYAPPGQIDISREMMFVGVGLLDRLFDIGQKDMVRLSINASAGQEYYVMWKNGNTMSYTYSVRDNQLVLKTKETASPMIKKCRLLGEIDIPRQ